MVLSMPPAAACLAPDCHISIIRELMNSIAIGLIVAACVLTGGLIGLYLHRFLPRAHLTKETQDVVRLGTGMLSVLASLVLGLLIATAKSSYDTVDHNLRSYAADLILLNETLRDYAQEAAVPRDLLRRYTELAIEDNWPKDGNRPVLLEDAQAGELLEHVRESIRALRPVDEGQRWLQDQALQINTSLQHQRWLLIEQTGPSVRHVVLVILVSWISFIFASFGLNAPRNATVVVAFLVCSLAIGGSIFLILEMDNPFQGTMKVSSRPMLSALAHMSP
jgi:hypothetical protein